jgi:hypothetical protein
MTLPVPFGVVIIDRTAAVQQLAAVAAVYQNRPTDLAELFDPAQVVHFLHDNDGWPPSFAVISWPPGQWLIVIGGTTNLAPQVLNHIAGSFGRPGGGDPVTCNGQWAGVVDSLLPVIDPIIGDLPAEGHVYISGHSYGAAVGAILAVHYAGRWGGGRVSLLQMGSPKSFTDDRPAEFPGVWHRVESTYDPVPSMPPTIIGVAVIDHWANPLNWLPRFPHWVHYGREWVLYPGGEWNTPAPDPNPLPPGVSTNPVNAHRLRNYWGRFSAYYATHGGSAAYAQALEICDRVLLHPPATTPVERLPRVVPGPDGSPFLVPDYDGVTPSPALTVRSAMALAPVALEPPYFKMTHFFNWGESGWDESYWLATTGGDNPMLTCVNWGIELAHIRRKALWEDARYVGLRVSDFEPPHKSTPDKNSGVGVGTFAGTVDDAPLPKGSCVFIRQQDNTFTYDAERIYRGVSREFLGTDNINVGKVTPTPKMQQWLQQMTNFTRNQYGGPANPGGATVRCGILSTDRQPTNPTSPVTKVDVDPSGFLRVTVVNDVFPAIEGSRVHLSVNRTRCARGISGRYVVRARTTDATGRILTLNKRPCCPPESLVTLMGTIRLVPKVMFQSYWFEYSAVGHRNTGRPNFSTAGRRPSKCC